MSLDWQSVGTQLFNLIVTVTIPIGGALWTFFKKLNERLSDHQVRLQILSADVARLGDAHILVNKLSERMAVIESRLNQMD